MRETAHPDLLPEIPGSALLFLILEPFLHSAAAIILVVPVVMPQVNRVGIDPLHFGLIVTINLGTPPADTTRGEHAADPLPHRQGRPVGSYHVNVSFVAVLLAVLILVTDVPVTAMGSST